MTYMLTILQPSLSDADTKIHRHTPLWQCSKSIWQSSDKHDNCQFLLEIDFFLIAASTKLQTNGWNDIFHLSCKNNPIFSKVGVLCNMLKQDVKQVLQNIENPNQFKIALGKLSNVEIGKSHCFFKIRSSLRFWCQEKKKKWIGSCF